MKEIRLSRLELQIMDVLWAQGEASIREIQESFSEAKRPAYATVQTTVYRLEAKKAVQRTRKLGNFHIFSAIVSREATQHRMLDDLLAMFGGQSRPVMARLIETGKLTLEDVEFAEKTLRSMQKKGRNG
ncbi:MAG TPA: BlaI/MecI/CopY family transcriptional regulator [Edaphobacter sp.]|nr:BlaI/MecI/CopY family transcriptional regulator [Edaphobacter sp.]